MIRKAALAVVALTAVATLGVALGSFAAPLHWRIREAQGTKLGFSLKFHGGKAYVWIRQWTDTCRPMRRGEWAGFTVRTASYLPKTNNTVLPKMLAVLRGQGTWLRVTWLRVPLWGPLVLLNVWPLAALIRGPVRRYRRRRKGLCVRCGYDLRGSVSAVCSECGEPILRGEST